MTKTRKISQRGDTIIEVLIAITIVSLILGGAYVTSNNSLLATRDAQEHGDALQLVQSQVEQIRALAADGASGSNDPFTATTPFCIINTNQILASSNAACTMNNSGQPANGVQPEYAISINRSSSNNNTFIITNSWSSVIGNSRAQEQMIYRLYP